jgi:hypothetical protein
MCRTIPPCSVARKLCRDSTSVMAKYQAIFAGMQRRSYQLSVKTDKITYGNITSENCCGVRRRIAAKIESDGGNLSEPDRSPPLRSRVEARPTRKKVLSTSSNHLNQKQKINKWYLVVETPTTPCDAFFSLTGFRSMSVEDRTEIPPHGIVQKESFVESCDCSLEERHA